MKAEYNVPAVLLLSAEILKGRKNDISGSLFEIGCGLHMKTCLRPVAGVVHEDLSVVTPEAMVMNWRDDVLTKFEFYKDIPIGCVEYDYCDRDVILYSTSYNESPCVMELPCSPGFRSVRRCPSIRLILSLRAIARLPSPANVRYGTILQPRSHNAPRRITTKLQSR